MAARDYHVSGPVTHKVATRPCGTGSVDGNMALVAAQALPSPGRCRDAASAQSSPRQFDLPTHLSPKQLRRVPVSMNARKAHLRSERSEESSNASQWYRDSNQNVLRDEKTSFADDVPFYLDNQPRACAGGLNARVDPAESIDRQSSPSARSDCPSMRGLQGNEVVSEEFRVVIDDLTVENRKLRQKLRQYQKRESAHLKRDKLFEVRIQGLPPDKKRELEETLRGFAVSLGESGGASTTHSSSQQVPASGARKKASGNRPSPYTSSESTSYSKPVDSAYASLSASDRASTTQGSRERQAPGRSSQEAHDRKVESYLHEIPVGPYPARSLAMSDVDKKRLVVRRLEQLFAGKVRDVGGHSQPAQQQEISQSAARADRLATKARGHDSVVEGVREAHIFPTDGEEAADCYMTGGGTESSPDASGADGSSCQVRLSHKTSLAQDGDGLGEQRPTRPLDLDPHRAQHAADNIGYIRHLGLPNPVTGEMSMDGQPDGWVYLNLLTSMAQLHTINVTPEFVRKAVRDVSRRFQLSADGRKVRWVGDGGGGLSGAAGDGRGSGERGGRRPSDESETDSGVPTKRRKLNDSSTSERSPEDEQPLVPDDGETLTAGQIFQISKTGAGAAVPWPLAHPLDSDQKYQYKPLFVHTPRSDDDTNSSQRDLLSSSSAPDTPHRHRVHPYGKVGGGDRGLSSSPEQRRQDGPIIFYNTVHFCTDLSGDAATNAPDRPLPIAYERLTPRVMGVRLETPLRCGDPADSDLDGRRRTSSDVLSGATEKMALDDSGAREGEDDDDDDDEEMLSGLDPFDAEEAGATDEMVAPRLIIFEAFGLFGVYPMDNFAVRVRSRHRFTTSSCRRTPGETGAALRARVAKVLDELSSRLRRPLSSREASMEGETGRENPWPALAPKPDGSSLAFRSEILTSVLVHLPPSELPPPSYVLVSLSSSEASNPSILTLESGVDFSSTSGDRQYLDPMREHGRLPLSGVEWHQPQRVLHIESGSDEESDVGSDSGSSIDLLAAARELDPETIAEREREFDRHAGPQFAEELPAGSSAATVGGGSGFSSDDPSTSGSDSQQSLEEDDDSDDE